MGNVCSISISIDDVLSRCGDCAARPVNYICNLEDNYNDLMSELDELKELKNDVLRKVDIAERQQMKRLDQVQGWISRVEAMEAQVDKLIRDGSQEIENKCLGGCCPINCKSSYILGKKFATTLGEVAVLKSKGVFEVVADELPLAPLDERPSGPIVGLEWMIEFVWSYIEDEEVGIIGLYGMGGVGKTTLMTEINNKLYKGTLPLDVTIWVVVSRTPDTVNIQDEIGKRIGFRSESWKNKSQEEKCSDIFRVLNEKKFVLFLDDMWERIDLSKLGIPFPKKQNKSKVVFTTRSESLCGEMGAHEKIKVECLTWEGAWDLFRKNVGEDTINAHPEITKLGMDVARKCDGLPLALIIIGRAMSCKKTSQEWRHAIAMLKNSKPGMRDNLFALLKFSYDSLPSDTSRSCLLYCSLFPEDRSISRTSLIGYWVGEGFLDNCDDLNGSQNEGHEIIGSLIRACLLEECYSYRVKMHDVIRDMALWIARECGEVEDKFLVEVNLGLTKAPKVARWKQVERLSLMCNSIEKLTETPSCPNLSTFLLSNNNLKMIKRGFFQSMPNLKVLDLSWNSYLSELPVEICELVNLQYLCLFGTRIRELPIDFKNLVGLKFLGLSWTKRLNIIPFGVISSLKMLQVLRLTGCGSPDLSVEGSVLAGHPETLMKELDCLENLNDLSFTIKTKSSLQPFLKSLNLRSCTRSLCLQLFRGEHYLDLSFLTSVGHLDTLRIVDCFDFDELVVEWAREDMEYLGITSHLCFHNLRFLYINNCPRLKNLTWLIFAPYLKHIDIRNCVGMEKLIHGGRWDEGSKEGGGCLNTFGQLEALVLDYVPQLVSICSDALPFSFLKSIHVYDCPRLKKLPLNSNSAKGCRLEIFGYSDWWNALEWKDEAARNAFLSSFFCLKE